MSAKETFEYAVLRVVPRVERGEALNAGVVVYCQSRDVLEAVVEFDPARALALAPDLDVPTVQRHLDAAVAICAGTHPATSGMTAGQRFRWLTAPRSTVVQPGPVHTGLTDDPDAEADRLLRLLVLPVQG